MTAYGAMSRIISYVTGATEDDGFGGPAGGYGGRRDLLVFDAFDPDTAEPTFRFRRTDTDATVVMTTFMMTVGDDSPPPTAALWATYVGDEGPTAYVKQGMLLHVLYGIGAGVAFAVGATALALDVGAGVLVGSVLWGVAFGLVLVIGGMVFWMRIVLAMEPDPKTMGASGFFHPVYGVVLGASIALLPV